MDGNVFLDCTAGIAVTSTGHSHPEVVQAIVEQAQRFPAHVRHRLLLRAAGAARRGAVGDCADAGPAPLVLRQLRHRSQRGGAEAGEVLHTKRHNVIAFLGSFHGRSMGSLSLTASKLTQRRGFGPFVPGTYHAPYANCYRCPVGLKPESCAAECLRFIEEQLLVHLVSPDEVAAIMVEPIQGEGGYVVPPDVFLQRLREMTRQHGMLLIVDEVQSGMGRTGRMFAIEHAGVEPDVVTMAKGIASGLPLGVATARSDVMSWPPGTHASTFGGNPVACAAALATIRLLRESPDEERGGRRRAHDERRSRADGEAPDHRRRPRPRADDRHRARARSPDEGARHHRARRRRAGGFTRGLLVLGAGPNAIRLSPPLVLTTAQADTALGILDQAIGVVTRTTAG